MFICMWIDYIKAFAASARNYFVTHRLEGEKSFSSSKFPRQTTDSFNRSNYFSKCWWILMPRGGFQVLLKLVSPADTQKHLYSVWCNIDTALNQKNRLFLQQRDFNKCHISFLLIYSKLMSCVSRFPLEIQIWKVQREMIILCTALLTYELWNYHWKKIPRSAKIISQSRVLLAPCWGALKAFWKESYEECMTSTDLGHILRPFFKALSKVHLPF